VALGFWLGLVAVGPGRCGQLRVNLSIRMVAVRRGRRQEDEEEQSIQGPRAKCQGLLLDWRKHFLLPTISVPQNKPQPPQNYTTVGSLTLPLPLLLTGTSAMGQAQLLRSSYITATLGAERGCERQHFRWSSHYLPQAWRRACHAGPRRLTLCSGAQEQERYQINVRTIEARDEAQEAKMEAVSARPKARAIVIARSSSSPGGSSCPPSAPPFQTLEYIGSLLRFVLYPFSNSHRPRQSSGNARHTGSRWCHMAPYSLLPQFPIALRVWYRRGSDTRGTSSCSGVNASATSRSLHSCPTYHSSSLTQI
jgi:hypothetical protein